MSKSRKHLKRRNLSNKKVFHIGYKNTIKTIKALDSRTALNKDYRLAIKHHEIHLKSLKTSISSLIKLVKKITPKTESQKKVLENRKKEKKHLKANKPMFDKFKLMY